MTVLAVVAVALGVVAQNSSKAPESKSDQYDATSKLLYELDTETLEAVIKDWASLMPGQVYTQTELIVPAYFEVKSLGISMGGDSQSSKKVYVVEIGEKAFYGAEAASVVFADGSKVRIIRKQGLANMPNMKGTLTLPASLKALEASAVLLPDITKLVFLGTEAPECMLEGDYNSWTANGVATPKDVEVVVPDGSLAAYKKKVGIGNYFTNIHTQSNKYLVVFYDEDGVTELQSVETVYGTVPAYTGTEPAKAEDENYTYTFDGWDKTLSAVTGDDVYKATYKATAKTVTAVETPAAEEQEVQKTVDNGVLYIIRGGVRYDARGQRVAQ